MTDSSIIRYSNKVDTTVTYTYTMQGDWLVTTVRHGETVRARMSTSEAYDDTLALRAQGYRMV